jgi:hypothetical protein
VLANGADFDVQPEEPGQCRLGIPDVAGCLLKSEFLANDNFFNVSVPYAMFETYLR